MPQLSLLHVQSTATGCSQRHHHSNPAPPQQLPSETGLLVSNPPGERIGHAHVDRCYNDLGIPCGTPSGSIFCSARPMSSTSTPAMSERGTTNTVQWRCAVVCLSQHESRCCPKWRASNEFSLTRSATNFPPFHAAPFTSGNPGPNHCCSSCHMRTSSHTLCN